MNELFRRSDELETAVRNLDARELARVIRACKAMQSAAESVMWQRTVEHGEVDTDKIPNGFTALASYLRKLHRSHVRSDQIPGGFSTMASYLTWFEWVTGMLEGDSITDILKAFEELGKHELVALHEVSIVRLLKHHDMYVRERALETMGKLDAAVLIKYTADLFSMGVHDTDYNVRRIANETLDKLEPGAVAHVVVDPLRDTDQLRGTSVGVKNNALRILQKLGPVLLRHYTDIVVYLLRDSDEDVRQMAAAALRGLDPVDLELSAHEVAPLIADMSYSVRSVALCTLGRLNKTALATYAPIVSDLLGNDTFDDVERTALNTLGKLDQTELATYAANIVRIMVTDYWWPDTTVEALTTLGKLNRTDLEKYRAVLVNLKNDSSYRIVREKASATLEKLM